jgi:16S rRNA (guanine966-N2)-methyltransferase
MRIIGGTYRGRQIAAPEGMTTRPMTDRVRENLFNLLREDVDGAVVLDVFSGSGALGLEAISRGATTCTFVDADEIAIEMVTANCRRLGLEKRVRIQLKNVLRPGTWIKPQGADKYTLIFADPPYKLASDLEGQVRLVDMIQGVADLGVIAPGAVAMLRVKRDTVIPLPWPGFRLFDERTYGTTTLYLMMFSPEPQP